MKRKLQFFLFLFLFSIGVGYSQSIFQQDNSGDGLIVFEAESFTKKDASSTDSWDSVTIGSTTPTGGFAMQCGPNNGTRPASGVGPVLKYYLDLQINDTLYVWIKGAAAGSGDNDVRYSIDNQNSYQNHVINASSTLDYGWKKNNDRFIVPGSTGIHVFKVWMRDDGSILDKFVLSTNPNFATPSGDGPAVSSSYGLNLAPSMNTISNVNVWVAAGEQTIDIVGIDDGDYAKTQTVTATASSSTAGIITGLSVSSVVNGKATLTYTPAAVGSTNVTVTITDDGGTSNGGEDTYSYTFKIQVLANDIVNGWADDFEDGNMNWYVATSGMYTLTESDGVLKINGNKNKRWESFGRNIGKPIDISANPVMNVHLSVIDSTRPILLTAYIKDGDNNNKAITQRVTYSQNSHIVSFDYSAETGVNFQDIRTVFFAINGNVLNYGGITWFDKVSIGDSAVQYSTIQPIADIAYYKNTGPHKVFISDVYNSAGLTFNGASSLLQSANFSVVDQYNVDTLILTLKADAVGSDKVSITSVGAKGFTDNSAYFTFTIEDNMEPTIDQQDDIAVQVGAEKVIKLKGITDGNRTVNQNLTITATSSATGVIANPTIKYNGKESPYAYLTLTATSAQADVSIEVTVDDGESANNQTKMSFLVTSYDALNNAPTITEVDAQSSLKSSGVFKIPVGGISDGDAGTQVLTITATSSNTEVVANPINVNYTQGSSVAILDIDPLKIGSTTITVLVVDNGDTGTNNGNQSATISFDYTAKKDPLYGNIVPLADIQDQAPGTWSPESYLSRYFLYNDSLGTPNDNVIKIEMKNKTDWNGIWVEVPEMDLTNHPYTSMEIYPEDDDIYFMIWYYDANGYRNTTGPSAEVKHCIKGQWNKIFFDFRPDGYLYGKKLDDEIDISRIDAILMCMHYPMMEWPNTTYTGDLYLRNFRNGSEAELPVTSPMVTLNKTPDQVHAVGDGLVTITLSNLSNGAGSTAGVTVNAVSSVSGVANPVVSAVNPDGTATLTYTPGVAGNTEVIITVSAPGSITTRDTLNIGVRSTNSTDAITVDVNMSTTYQTMHGFGSWGISKNSREIYTKDLGASAIRIGFIGNQLEPINDNSDPYSLDRSKLNYSALDWSTYKYLAENGVEHFILSSWSAPAWMKNCLNLTQLSGSNRTELASNRLDFHMYEEFAEMCVATCLVFEEKVGIPLYGIGLQNEPTFHEPYPSGILSADYFYKLAEVVGKRFEAEGITTKIYMPEQVFSQGGGVSTRSFLDSLQAHPSADQYVPAIAVHGYAPDGIGAGMPDTAQWSTLYANCQEGPNPKELWMTETFPEYKNWNSALKNAGSILSSIRYGNISWWTSWVAIGQLLDKTNQPTQSFYTNKHIFKYVRPGATRIYSKTSNFAVYDGAFINEAEDGGNLVVVLINDSTNAVSVKLNINGGTVPGKCDVYLTRDLAPIQMVASGVSASELINMPPKSIVTIVANPNPNPVFDDIEDQIIAESSNEQAITITGVGDGEGGSQVLSFVAISDNVGLVPTPNISYNQGESTATLKYTPTAGITGSAKITVRLTDDGSPEGFIEKTFTINVSGINHTPEMTVPATATCDEDAGEQIINITGISDGDGGTQVLTFSVTDGDAALISTPLISYSGGTTATVKYTPVANANGICTIDLTLKDNGGSGNGAIDSKTVSINITVNAVNDKPTINSVSAQNAQASTLKTVNLSGISDGDPEEDQTLTITASSDNQAVLADGDISINYTAGEATAALSYTASSNGTANVTVSVKDNAGTANGGIDTETISFAVNISATANSNPTIDLIDPVTILEDAIEQTINLAGISDGDAGSQGVTIVATSDNIALIPNPAVTYTSGSTGSLNFTPVTNANGIAKITVVVTDGGTPAAETQVQFNITVTSVNDAPVMDAINNVTVLEDASEVSVDLTGIADGDEGLQAINITATSDNLALISTVAVDYTSGATGTLKFTPETGENGEANITVTLTDNGGTANSGINVKTYTFKVTVTSVNSAPEIDGVISQDYNEDAVATDITLTGITDGGDGGQNITITATEVGSEGLLENISVAYTQGESTAILSYSLVANANGTTNIKVLVEDDGGVIDGGVDASSILIPVVITPVNDAPTFDPLADETINVNEKGVTVISLENTNDGDPELDQRLTVEFSATDTTFFDLLIYDDVENQILIGSSGKIGNVDLTITLLDNGDVVAGGENSTSQTISIDFVNETKTISAIASTVKVYPVPAHNFLTIDAGSDMISSISMIDVSGRVVISQLNNVYETLSQVDVSHIQPGIYFISIEMENKTEIKQILIK